MKNIFKIMLLVSICFFSIIEVKAIDKNNLELYTISNEKIIDNIITYYQKNNSILKILVNKDIITKKIEEADDIEIEVYEENSSTNDFNYNYYQETANFDSKYTDLANYALQFVGNPYVYGGTSLTEGADCSGFVMKLYENYGVSLPRTANQQATVGYSVSIENAQPGDIISYGYNGIVSHSAIYIGNQMIVHASTPEGGIKTSDMYIMPIVTIRRIG